MTDEFLSRAAERLRGLEKDDAALAAQEEGVRRRRAVLQEEIAKVQAAISVYQQVMDRQEAEAEPQPLFDVPEMGSISDMAYMLIRREPSGRLHTKEIARRLVQAGKLSDEKKDAERLNYAKVFAILRRDRRFTKPDPGYWTIASTPSAPPLPSSQSLAAAQD